MTPEKAAEITKKVLKNAKGRELPKTLPEIELKPHNGVNPDVMSFFDKLNDKKFMQQVTDELSSKVAKDVALFKGNI